MKKRVRRLFVVLLDLAGGIIVCKVAGALLAGGLLLVVHIMHHKWEIEIPLWVCLFAGYVFSLVLIFMYLRKRRRKKEEKLCRR